MTVKERSALVSIASDGVQLEGVLELPAEASGVVLFAHGSGSSRLSPRNRFVAQQLREAGLATLLLDLLTAEEDRDYEQRFDIVLLSRRLADAGEFLRADPRTAQLPLGLFGASTGAAAALEMAASVPERVAAVVSRGGRPDLVAAAVLRKVRAPTLLIVGSRDHGVIELNEQAYAHLTCEKKLELVAGATHLFEEAGTLDRAARLAADWFLRNLVVTGRRPRPAP